MPSQTTVVFVYGSLRRGQPNHGLLGGRAPRRSARTLPEWDLVDLGAYPALVPGGTTVVVGEIYEVDAETLARLDELEGHPDYYFRTAISLDAGEVAHAYVMAPDAVLGRPRIVSGDWCSG